MDNKPMFFKVFLSLTSSQKLLIPLAFSAQMKGAFPKQALLQNQRGKVWSVNITNKESKFYFTNAWRKFVKYNNVEDGDFLLFNYGKSHVFDVTIYDHNTMCNKMVAEYEERESEDGDETEEEEFEIETSEGLENSKKKGKAKFAENDKRLQMVVVSSQDEKDFDNNESIMDYKRNKAAKPKGKAKGKSDAKLKGKASEASDDEDEIFKHGIIARPKTPYFVTKLHAKRPNKLYIPLDVIRDFNLEIPEKIIILDEENKEWQSNVKVWGDGRYWVTNGWKAFRKWNALTWHDRCLCEFVKESGPRGLFLKIRILREGSWLPKGNN